jgi:hypothetical protein
VQWEANRTGRVHLTGVQWESAYKTYKPITPRQTKGRGMRYLFFSNARGYYHPAKSGPNLHIEQADCAVVAIFRELQNAWQRQGRQRTTFDAMQASGEERKCWRRLIRYLTRLPPPPSREQDHSSVGRADRRRHDYWRHHR